MSDPLITLRPFVPVLNSNHPIANGLILDAAFFSSVGSNTQDLTGINLNGILSGNTIPTVTSNADTLSSCLQFDGVTSWVNYGDNPLIHLKNNMSMTWEMWFISTGRDSTTRMLFAYDRFDSFNGQTGGARPLYQISITNGNKIDVTLGSTANTLGELTGNATILQNKLYHCVIVRSKINSSFYIYLNGVLDASGNDASTGTWETINKVLMIGRYTDIPPGATATFFKGKIFVARMWNRAISSQEIQQLYYNPWSIYKIPLFKVPLIRRYG